MDCRNSFLQFFKLSVKVRCTSSMSVSVHKLERKVLVNGLSQFGSLQRKHGPLTMTETSMMGFILNGYYNMAIEFINSYPDMMVRSMTWKPGNYNCQVHLSQQLCVSLRFPEAHEYLDC